VNFRSTVLVEVNMGIPGAFGDTKTPTEDQVAVLNALKAEVIALFADLSPPFLSLKGAANFLHRTSPRTRPVGRDVRGPDL
jgi:hypothetical protein